MKDLDAMKELFDKMKPPAEKGFVFLPSVKGFDIFEFDAGTLKVAMTLAKRAEDLTSTNR